MSDVTDPPRKPAQPETMSSARAARPAVMRDEPEPQPGLPDHKPRRLPAGARYALVALAVLALLAAGVFAYRAFNRVVIADLAGQTLTATRAWASKSRLELDVRTRFDMQIGSDIVIDQSIAPGTTVRKKTVLALTVSKGPDPDEHLQLPAFSTMTTAEIRAWIDETKAFNVNLVQQYSETVSTGRVIRVEFADASVHENNFTRRDYLAVYLSRGPQPPSQEILVPDFTGYTREQVAAWQQSRDVRVILTETGSDDTPAGLVFGQDIPAGTTVAAQSEIHLSLSLGRGEEIPDYAAVYADDAMAVNPRIALVLKQAYSNETPYGRLISQSAPAGETRYGENIAVTLIYSLGRPYIGQLAGWMENELPAYFFDFNSKGCSLTYTVVYVDSYIEKGMVVRTSRYNEYLWLASDVEIQVSKGNLPVPTEPTWPLETMEPVPPPETVPPTPTPVLGD